MNRTIDLGIGQRLALGFGGFVVVLLLLLATLASWQEEAAKVQASYSERLAPVRERLHQVERKIYLVGIAVRAVMLEPSAQRVAMFEQRMTRARTNLQLLAQVPLDAEYLGDAAQLHEAVDRYFAAADEAVALASSAAPGLSAAERRLTDRRDAVTGMVDRFSEMLSARASEKLAAISASRDHVRRGMLALGLLSLVALGLLAWLTSRSIVRPARALLQGVAAMEQGDWKPALRLAAEQAPDGMPPQDEMRRLAGAFGSAAQALDSRQRRLHAEGAVARAVASTLDATELAERVLGVVVEHVGGGVGAVYMTDDATRLVPIGGFALGDHLPTLEIGDSIPGQAARSRRAVHLCLPDDSGLRIAIGHEQVAPRAVLALPLLFGERLLGVLMVGALRDFDDDARGLLDSAATQLGIGLQNVAAYREVQALLDQVRGSHQQIQAQNEQLQAQNEELQAQSEEIQAQGQQLQAQHEELHAQNEELIQQSEELRRHSESLAEADERKNAFLGVLAHELRNPMAPIVNCIHILRNAPAGSPAVSTAHSVIERQATHLVRLIDDLMDVTRISEGKVNIERVPVDLVEIARACVEDVAVGFERAGITLALALPPQPVMIEGDRTRLCQVIGNLLNNSLKFCARGGRVAVTVEVDGTSVHLHVDDDGIGIDSALLPRLFRPFTQGVNGLARTHGGLGLGLALARALVELHGGTIWAESAGVGCGARFSLRLPLARRLSKSTGDAAIPAVAPVARVPLRVLLVEDNLDAANTLRVALELEGFEVRHAASGDAGLAAARAEPPDIVLCDIGLPDRDGYSVAGELRADPALDGSVLIALTGYASPADRRRADAAGFDAHLAKPLQIRELRTLVARLREGAASA